jgi:hypothetical protein
MMQVGTKAASLSHSLEVFGIKQAIKRAVLQESGVVNPTPMTANEGGGENRLATGSVFR